MDYFKQWSFCICVSLVIAVVLSLFEPKGRMNSFYKILISVFIFASFVYPLGDLNIKDIKFNDNDIRESENIAAPYENTLKAQVNSTLKDGGVTGASVNPEIKVNYQSGEIEIRSLRIAVSDEYDKKAVKELIFEKLGINAEVVSIGE